MVPDVGNARCLTGMSCPMNCPKSTQRSCGGVRGNGNCEVKPEMKCVWVAAWEGSRTMRGGDKILEIQKPVDHSLKGTSSWLKVVRDLRPPAPPANAKKSARPRPPRGTGTGWTGPTWSGT
jgi:hypothetical protein